MILKNVKAIPRYLRHSLVVADINKIKLKSDKTNHKVERRRVEVKTSKCTK